jgi:hypothetical protein
MSDLDETSRPFDAGTFHQRCLACGTCNQVQVTEQFGHHRPHDYYCAHCHHCLGSLRASDPPATSVVDDARCSMTRIKDMPWSSLLPPCA